LWLGRGQPLADGERGAIVLKSFVEAVAIQQQVADPVVGGR
jgi:hypothetical protein